MLPQILITFEFTPGKWDSIIYSKCPYRFLPSAALDCACIIPQHSKDTTSSFSFSSFQAWPHLFLKFVWLLHGRCATTSTARETLSLGVMFERPSSSALLLIQRSSSPLHFGLSLLQLWICFRTSAQRWQQVWPDSLASRSDRWSSTLGKPVKQNVRFTFSVLWVIYFPGLLF